MPRSLEEALAQADELAAEFEAFDPTDAVHIDPAEYALQRAARARARAEREVADAVVDARRHDVPWRTIGESLGVTPQSAQRRYAVIVDASKRSTSKRSTSKRTAAPSALSKQGRARTVSGAVAAHSATSGRKSIRTKAAANVKAGRAAATSGKKAAKPAPARRAARSA